MTDYDDWIICDTPDCEVFNTPIHNLSDQPGDKWVCSWCGQPMRVIDAPEQQSDTDSGDDTSATSATAQEGTSA